MDNVSSSEQFIAQIESFLTVDDSAAHYCIHLNNTVPALQKDASLQPHEYIKVEEYSRKLKKAFWNKMHEEIDTVQSIEHVNHLYSIASLRHRDEEYAEFFPKVRAILFPGIFGKKKEGLTCKDEHERISFDVREIVFGKKYEFIPRNKIITLSEGAGFIVTSEN